jgi:solute carrier family 25 (mitochondrial phosphate transporter), member 3
MDTAGETEFKLSDLSPKDVLPLWAGFAPTLSRELPFAIVKFLVFDILARTTVDLINSQTQEGALPVQVGVGLAGLAVSAMAGAIAGVAGAIVSHPADLILTKTSVAKKKSNADDNEETPGWVTVVKDLLSQDGGVANLFVGLPARATFFFLVIGLQFFLYDYVKNVFQVGTEDLSLVLDVFYAVRAGLVDMDPSM